MIKKSFGSYVLVCDICGGEEAKEQFDDFYDAVEYKNVAGWKSKIEGEEWEDVCPECTVGDKQLIINEGYKLADMLGGDPGDSS